MMIIILWLILWLVISHWSLFQQYQGLWKSHDSAAWFIHLSQWGKIRSSRANKTCVNKLRKEEKTKNEIINELAAILLFIFCVLDNPGNIFLNSCYAFTVTGIKLIDEVLQWQRNANKVLKKIACWQSVISCFLFLLFLQMNCKWNYYKWQNPCARISYVKQNSHVIFLKLVFLFLYFFQSIFLKFFPHFYQLKFFAEWK